MTLAADLRRPPTERAGEPRPDEPKTVSTWGSLAWAAFAFSLFAFILFVAYNLQLNGQLTDRVANPDVTGAPRPVPTIFMCMPVGAPISPDVTTSRSFTSGGKNM